MSGLGIIFFFLFWPVSALYQKSKLKGPQELKGDTLMRSVRKALFCACVVWCCSVVAEELAVFLSAAGGYRARLGAQLCSSLRFSPDLTVLPEPVHVSLSWSEIWSLLLT